MTLAQALALGVIQGVTEFLPISSSGHLALAEDWIPGLERPPMLFDVVVHLGTLAAVLWGFRLRVAALGRGAWSLVSRGRPAPELERDRRFIGLIAIACLPTAIVGAGLAPTVVMIRTHPEIVGLALLGTAGILLASMRAGRGSLGAHELSLFDALLVGIAQGFSVIPGISRSGATIGVALGRGASPDVAVEFSLLAAVPAIAGANLFVVLTRFEPDHAIALAPLAAGFLAAFVAGLLALRVLRRVVAGRRFLPFAAYCVVLGLGAIAFG